MGPSISLFNQIIVVILVLKMSFRVNNAEVQVVQMERVSAIPICQGKTVKFKCENSSLVIVIYTATYGRSSDGYTVCPFDDEVNPSVRKMNDTADDNSIPCPERNVTLDIMRLCDFKRRCVVTANETYFGNPCKGVYKYLTIIYACDEKHKSKARTPPFFTPPTITDYNTSPTPSTGLLITIPENRNNFTNSTVPVKTTRNPGYGPGSDNDLTHGSRPTSSGVSSDIPVVMPQKGQAAVMGVAGSLYLWFLHMKENKTAYVTVFILSAFGAALLMIGVVVFFVTAGKKKEFIKLDVMHRPKRYIALPKATKQSNQNGQGPAKEEKGLDDPDRSVQRKGPEVVFTAQDVNNQVKKEFSIDRFTGTENGTVHKGEPASIQVNPMFKSGNNYNNNNNKPSIVITDQPQLTDTASSLPSTPARSHIPFDPRTGTAKRTRANSTGNVAKSHHKLPDVGLINYDEEKECLPRHLSAGNVSHPHRLVANFDNSSPQGSSANTLPNHRSGPSGDSFYPSMARNTTFLQPAEGAPLTTAKGPSGVVNNLYLQHSPERYSPNDAAINQYPASSSTLNHSQQKQDCVSLQYGSLRQSARASPIVPKRTDSYYQTNPSDMSGKTKSLQATRNSSPMKITTSQRQTIPETTTPYSNHRETQNSMRKNNDIKGSNDAGFNITTNPNFSSKPEDIWRKSKESQLGQSKLVSGSLPGSDPNSIAGGISQHRGISSEGSVLQRENASKGTLRAPSLGELLSPLDALPDAHSNNPSLRSSELYYGNSNSTTTPLQSFQPPPPEMPTDSSEDDLFSIVAKGTYSSAVPSPFMRHTSGNASIKREGKNTNKHDYVVVPSGDGSTAV
ncbi:uncharacterized protein LOC114975259 isoform X3 [Acropora millepora]|uniref:uncharacterized protein LOC114975259 isoform X3 n=1 Tax=Acropora millepora TaxID=45264 RepID=UPI001CF3183F|nr:uncharacterized protein LOC114975259 isoform X3 [Acropora millepora]